MHVAYTSRPRSTTLPKNSRSYNFSTFLPPFHIWIPRFLCTRLNSSPCLVLLSQLLLRALQSGLGATSFIEAAVASCFPAGGIKPAEAHSALDPSGGNAAFARVRHRIFKLKRWRLSRGCKFVSRSCSSLCVFAMPCQVKQHYMHKYT